MSKGELSLRDGTVALLRRMHSRRELKVRKIRSLNGNWRWSRHRIRTTADFVLIANFPRCPARIRDACQRELNSQRAEAQRQPQRGATVTVNCKCCRAPFVARVADRKRGWARFCSKSCKAIRQTQKTGRGKPRGGEPMSDWDRYGATIHPFSPEAFEQ